MPKPSRENQNDLLHAVALYQSVNKSLVSLKAGSRDIVERTATIKSNLPEIESELNDLESNFKELKRKFDENASILQLPKIADESFNINSLKKQLKTLISENASLLAGLTVEDLALVADYQQSLKKQIEMMSRKKELMEKTHKLELELNFHKWLLKAKMYFDNKEQNLIDLLELHREYYDYFLDRSEDKNQETVLLHDLMEKEIEAEVEAILIRPQSAEELFSLVERFSILEARKPSPTLNVLIHPLLVNAFKDTAMITIKNNLQALSDYVKLACIYERLSSDKKQQTTPLAKKIIAQVELILTLQFKNELLDLASDKSQLKQLFYTLPSETQKKLKVSLGPKAFAEEKKQLTTQYSDRSKRPSAGSITTSTPQVPKSDPRKLTR